MNTYDVILVSSFGQLDPLSTEFARVGLKTLHLDVTEKLGSWPLEDREGPFGAFRVEKPLASWGEILNHGDLEIDCDDGLVIWTEMGPVSLRGPLSPHQLKSRGWLRETQNLNGKHDYEELVLPWLARSLFNTHFKMWSPENLVGSKVGISSPMSVRYPSRTGLEKRRDWIKAQNVTYWSDIDILDAIRPGADGLSGFEVKGPVNGVVKAQSIVWGLTSLETDHMSFRVREKIYQSDVRRPLWAWVRFRFQMTPTEDTAQWPQAMIMMTSTGVPWTHAELMIVHRTVLQDQFDVWVRIPDSKRFHQSYIHSIQDEIVMALKKKLGTLQIQLVHEPQEASYTSKELGPRPFSQYAEDAKPRAFQSKNLYFDSPEVWEHFSYDEIVTNQKKIFESIMVDWRKRMSKLETATKGNEI